MLTGKQITKMEEVEQVAQIPKIDGLFSSSELKAVIQNGRQLSLEFIEENLAKCNKGDLLNDYDTNCAF